MGSKKLLIIRLSLIFVCFAILSNCGKKAPPVAPETVIPQAIDNLRAKITNGMVILTWTIPSKNTNNSPLNDLKGFEVFRGEDRCKECPPDLSFLLDIDYNYPSGLTTIEGRTVKFSDYQVKQEKTYLYRVFSYNHRGHLSSASNLARAEVP